MKLLSDPSLKLTTGDFAAKVGTEGLKLPESLFRRLESAGIHTSGQFVAFCESAPMPLAMTLDWSLECMERAVRKLVATLEEPAPSDPPSPEPLVDHPLDQIPE